MAVLPSNVLEICPLLLGWLREFMSKPIIFSEQVATVLCPTGGLFLADNPKKL